MAASDVTLGSITNALLVDPDIRRAAFITAPGTGNPTLDQIKLRSVRYAVALKARHPEELDELLSMCPGTLDLVVVDPSHDYDISMHGLGVCLQLLRPGGILLCHDCVPPPRTTALQRGTDPEWCGVTFAAFRDTMSAAGVPWCTLGCDFGLGLAVIPREASPLAGSMAAERWTADSHDSYVGRYATDPFGFMRTVRPEAWRVAVDRLRQGEATDDLAARFNSWDDLKPCRASAPRHSLLWRIRDRLVKVLGGCP